MRAKVATFHRESLLHQASVKYDFQILTHNIGDNRNNSFWDPIRAWSYKTSSYFPYSRGNFLICDLRCESQRIRMTVIIFTDLSTKHCPVEIVYSGFFLACYHPMYLLWVELSVLAFPGQYGMGDLKDHLPACSSIRPVLRISQS